MFCGCEFINCNTDTYGGAVYVCGVEEEMLVMGTKFKNCGAEKSGGAIYSEGSLTLVNVTFELCISRWVL
jgi:predicted outer membrane repeat protein